MPARGFAGCGPTSLRRTCRLVPSTCLHDRAVFHFLVTAEQRIAYIQLVARAVRPGGHVIVGAFGPDGPAKCSGLDVARYDAGSLHREFGGRFRLVEHHEESHETPFGTMQQFVYCYCRFV